MKYLKRLISLPFALAIVTISAAFGLLTFIYLFMRYGSEFIVYDEKATQIKDVYNLLREELGIEDYEEERAVGERAPK